MIQNKIRAKSFQVSNIFWVFYVYLLGSAVLVVVYTLDFNFICVNNMVYMTSLLLNPIPTGCCHVILIYGLIPPSARRNRVNIEKFVSSVKLKLLTLCIVKTQLLEIKNAS